MNQSQKIRQRKKLRAVKPSKQAEIYYRKQTLLLISSMQESVLSELRTPVNDALFSGAFKSFTKTMGRILEKLESFNVTDVAKNISIGFVSRLNKSNDRSTLSNLKNSQGIELNTISHSDIDDLVDIAVQKNVALIKSIKNNYIEDIGKILRDNVENGGRSTDLITQIKERGKVHENKAKFLARDQTARINADLTEIRSKALGSDTYVWSGSMDERERTTHKAMEGKLCKWSDPTVYSDDNGKTWKKRKAIGAVELQAGKDYNCRCVAIPVVNWS